LNENVDAFPAGLSLSQKAFLLLTSIFFTNGIEIFSITIMRDGEWMKIPCLRPKGRFLHDGAHKHAFTVKQALALSKKGFERRKGTFSAILC